MSTSLGIAKPSSDSADPEENGRGSAGPNAGRTANGRFAKRSHGRQVAALRRELLATTTEEDLQAAVQSLLHEAENGALAAIQVLLEYTIGKPTPAVDPDILDQQEWRLHQQAPDPVPAKPVTEPSPGSSPPSQTDPACEPAPPAVTKPSERPRPAPLPPVANGVIGNPTLPKIGNVRSMDDHYVVLPAPEPSSLSFHDRSIRLQTAFSQSFLLLSGRSIGRAPGRPRSAAAMKRRCHRNGLAK